MKYLRLFILTAVFISFGAYADGYVTPCNANFDGSITCSYPSVEINNSMYHVGGLADDKGDSAKGFCAIKGKNYVTSAESFFTGISVAYLSPDGKVVNFGTITPDEGAVVHCLTSLTCR